MLEDPAHRRFTTNYILPYLDQENEALQIMLERLGVQQEELTAIFNVPAKVGDGPFDLTPYFLPGQPLQYFLRPKSLDWKIQGQPDTSYIPSAAVNELDDVSVGNLGCQQYKWSGGVVYTTPSYTGVTLRMRFFALTQTVYDSAQNVMRGIGFILARQTAVEICASNNGMGNLQKRLERSLSRDKQNFSTLLVMQAQSQLIVPRGTKRGRATQISAGGAPFY